MPRYRWNCRAEYQISVRSRLYSQFFRGNNASWWFFTNPFEKYARPIGSSPQRSGWKFQKSLKPPPRGFVENCLTSLFFIDPFKKEMERKQWHSKKKITSPWNQVVSMHIWTPKKIIRSRSKNCYIDINILIELIGTWTKWTHRRSLYLWQSMNMHMQSTGLCTYYMKHHVFGKLHNLPIKRHTLSMFIFPHKKKKRT